MSEPTRSPQAPVLATRRSPVGWTVAGVLVLFASLFSFPRGVSTFIASIVRGGDDIAYSLGYLSFGAALVVVGILLLVKAARIRKANRLADQGAGATNSSA